MATINEQIEAAITLFASRPAAFSPRDVAIYADMEELEEAIGKVLNFQSTKKPAEVLDVSSGNPTREPRYLGTASALEWWIAATMRWAADDIDCVSSTGLAHAMSAAFDSQVWDAPPQSILNVGLDRFMVADGCIPDTFVFPWASLLNCHPRFEVTFREFLGSEQPYSLLYSSLAYYTNEMLGTLNSREARVIRLRFGLEEGRQHTLEEIGNEFRVSRERIRQIEAKALRKLRHPSRSSFLLRGLAADFMRSGGSLLLPKSGMAPEYSLLDEMLRISRTEIKELDVTIFTTRDLSKYLDYLRDDDNCQSNYDPRLVAEMLPFLSKSDVERVCISEEDYWNQRISVRWTRPRMILEALRSIGRAAHYREIAEKCNELFPDNQTTVRNWYGALSRENMEEFGIVWVGRKGMYGLKEHNYARPTMGLYDAVPEIVEREFLRTQQPVSDQVVIAELRKDRRELDLTSVNMVLGFSKRVESVGPGKYVPKASGLNKSSEARSSKLDISAAFEAFTENDAD